MNTARIVADLNAGYYGEWEVHELHNHTITLVHPISGRITEVRLPNNIRFRSDLNRYTIVKA